MNSFKLRHALPPVVVLSLSALLVAVYAWPSSVLASAPEGAADPAEYLERLRDAPAPADTLPDAARGAAAAQVIPERVRLLSATNGAQFFVAPGADGGVCLIGLWKLDEPRGDHEQDVAVTCDHVSAFAARGMYLSMGEREAHHAVLLVPDGFREAHATAAAKTSMPIRDNHLHFGPFSFEVDPVQDDAAVSYGTLRLEGDEVMKVPVPHAALEGGHGTGR